MAMSATGDRETNSAHGRLDGLASTSRSPGVAAMSSIRGQAAAARALLDELERVTASVGSDADLSEQTAEELERLGERLVDVAHQLATAHEMRRPRS